MKLALKMGEGYTPDYYNDRGDFKGEWYDREDQGFYRYLVCILYLGLVKMVLIWGLYPRFLFVKDSLRIYNHII